MKYLFFSIVAICLTALLLGILVALTFLFVPIVIFWSLYKIINRKKTKKTIEKKVKQSENELIFNKVFPLFKYQR